MSSSISNTSTGHTSTHSSQPTHFAASTIGDSGYVYGGTDIGNYLQDTDEYTPDVWVSKTDMPLPARYAQGVSTISNSMYNFGGSSTDGPVQDCDEYTPDVWVSKSDMPAPKRQNLAASTI